MKLRVLITVSMMLNLTLGVGLYGLLRPHPAVVSVARTIRATAVAPTVAANLDPQMPATVTNRIVQRLDWSQLAAEDFKIYRDNLRAIGCPDQTVRDIIVAEINEQFAQRRTALLAELQKRFWDLAAEGEKALNKAFREPVSQLNDERQALIEKILGPALEAQDAREAQRIERRQKSRERNYAWLPADKRDQLVGLEDRYDQMYQDFYETAHARGGGSMSDADETRLRSFEKERAEARKQLLTPEEYDEYQLRTSSAGRWPADVSGFVPTEEEWRTVARLQAKADQAQKELDESDLDDRERKARAKEMQSALQDTIKQTLGPERGTQYDLATDSDYQTTHRITQRYGLPDSVAVKVHGMQQEAEAQAKRVREDPALSATARQAALSAIQKETERSLSETLGGKVFGTFKEYHGDWLNNMNPGMDQ